MGFSIAMMNNIRDNSSQEYQERIPEASQENFLSVGIALEKYGLLYNEFFDACVDSTHDFCLLSPGAN